MSESESESTSESSLAEACAIYALAIKSALTKVNNSPNQGEFKVIVKQLAKEYGTRSVSERSLDLVAEWFDWFTMINDLRNRDTKVKKP